MLSLWYEDTGAKGDEADVHLARAAEYAARVPPSEVMCRIAADQAFRLVVSGRAKEALDLATRMIPIAEEADLSVGRALLLQWRGYARVTLGDPDGIGDLRRAADTLAERADPSTPAAYADPSTPAAYGNLAEHLRGLGDMPAADAAYITASRWADRHARKDHIDWMATEQAHRPTTPPNGTPLSASSPESTAAISTPTLRVRSTRGRIALARGRTEDALTDAGAIIGYATSR